MGHFGFPVMDLLTLSDNPDTHLFSRSDNPDTHLSRLPLSFTIVPGFWFLVSLDDRGVLWAPVSHFNSLPTMGIEFKSNVCVFGQN